MNAPIRRVSMVVIVMIIVLLANATYVQVFKADALKSDPRNNRVLLDEYSRQRGAITAGGEVVAVSAHLHLLCLERLTSATTSWALFAELLADTVRRSKISLPFVDTLAGIDQAEVTSLPGVEDALLLRRIRDEAVSGQWQRIVVDHVSPPRFVLTVTLEAEGGGTRVGWSPRGAAWKSASVRPAATGSAILSVFQPSSRRPPGRSTRAPSATKARASRPRSAAGAPRPEHGRCRRLR